MNFKLSRSSSLVWFSATLLWASIGPMTRSGHTDEPASSPAAASTNTSATTTDGSSDKLMKVTEIEGITEYLLDNGTRVLLFPDDSKEVVTVNMTVFVGSRHEGYGEAGMAHLLEHMLFKGTPDHPNVPKSLQDKGARFNGTTWMDRTNYYETLPASEENLEFAIALEADRLVNSNIRGEDLASEMTVVRNEFERGENSPIRVLMQRIQSAAYEWHNYGKSTIGNRSDIERVPVPRLRSFYKKFYRPDNVMVIVAGKFDPQTALDSIGKHFGSLKRPDVPIDDTYTTEPAQDGERTVVLRRVGDIQLAGTAYHIPSGSHPEFAAAKALEYILGDVPSGRLYRQMVETEIASNVYALCYAFREPGLLMALSEINVNHSIETARAKLVEILEDSFAKDPVTEEEVERAKQQLLKERELESADSDRIAVSLSDWAAQGDWRLYFLFRDAIESLTKEQVQDVAVKYLTRNNRTVGLFIPSEKSDRVTIPEAPDLLAAFKDYKGREAMSAGEAFDPTPATIEARTERGELMPGIQFAMLPKKSRGESVSMMMTVRFGNAETMLNKVGAIELLGTMMSRGTEKLNYQQLQDELTRLRAELSISSTPGLLQLQVKTKREFLPEVIALVGDILRHPRFEASELEVLRRQIITGLEQNSNDPQAVAPRMVRQKLSPYGREDIRYVQTLAEEIEMYRGVKIDEIKAAYETFLSNQAGEVAVVGDFDAEQVKTLVKTQLADWSTTIPYVRVDRPAYTSAPGVVELIETPDKANAVLYTSQQYELVDTSPEYAALVLGNYILGGSALSSRLGDRVRGQEGLSYGISSGLSARTRDNRTDFTLYAITNPQNKDRILEVIREEIDRIRKDGVTADELAKAKESYLQADRIRRTNDAYLVSELVSTMFNSRTMAYQAEHETQIESATIESVNSAIERYIQPDRFVTAVAGDFAAAESEK